MPRRTTAVALTVVAAMAFATAACSPGQVDLRTEPTPAASAAESPVTPSTAPAMPSPATSPHTRSDSGAEPAPAAAARQPVGGAAKTVAVVPSTGRASGAGVPRTSVQGRALRYWDDFTTAKLSQHWGVYDAVPRSSPHGLWRQSQVSVKNGKLVLRAQREGSTWVSGGLMNYGAGSTRYGSYLVRFRATKAVGIKYAILLWPETDDWPIDGEIDFAEDGGGARTGATASLHYGADHQVIQRHVLADFSKWHTVGVEWSVGQLDFVLDGRKWSSITGAGVPDGVMNLAIQTESVGCGDDWGACPDATTPAYVDLEVDWVAVYASH